MYLLDTNICIYIIKRKPPGALERLASLPLEAVAVSAITVGELQLGVEKSAEPERNQSALSLFLAPLTTLPFDAAAAVTYGKVRAQLERRGTPIGSLDTLIGAHALALKATLVTNNTRELERISGLSLENWV